MYCQHVLLHFLLLFMSGITCLRRPMLTAPKILEIAKNINRNLYVKRDLEIKGNSTIEEVSKVIIKGLSNDFQELKWEIMSKSSSGFRDKLTNRMDNLVEYTNDVQRLYEIFLYIYTNSNKFSSGKLEALSKIFRLKTSTRLETAIEKLHGTLVNSNPEEESMVTMIAESWPSDTICISGESSQQIIHKLFAMAVVTHTKVLLMQLYDLDLKEQFENVEYGNAKREVIQKYYSTIGSTSEKVRLAMSIASRELWKCDPIYHKKGLTFLKLEPIFQSTFLYEYNWHKRNESHDCQSLNNRRYFWPPIHWYLSPPRAKVCNGKVQDCQFIANEMVLCHAMAHKDRDYEWMETRQFITYGHKNESCFRKQTLRRVYSSKPCQCTCNDESRGNDRYFSLLNVVSDVDQNKVVTGVRLVKENHVFYIQIEQGILGRNGSIVNDTTEWKPVHTIPYHFEYSDYDPKFNESVNGWGNNLVYAVRRGRNTVYLDDLEGQTDELVTGLRFQQVGSDLRLGIQLTHFNYSTGMLIQGWSSWIAAANEVDKRSEVILTKPDEPIRAPMESDTFSKHNQYIRFRMSDLKRDLGQNTIPFIDSQYVITNPPSPLAGAGIFHKGMNNYGGFLALKLIHLDLSAHV